MSPVAAALSWARGDHGPVCARGPELVSAPGPTNYLKDNQCQDEIPTRRSHSSPRHSRGSHRAPGHSTPAATHPS